MGIFEECVSIDKDILQKVLIPIANISRRCMDGTKHSGEPLNQSELYIKYGVIIKKLIKANPRNCRNPF